MAKPNFQFEKRQKELEKKRKKEEKLKKKQEKNGPELPVDPAMGGNQTVSAGRATE